MRLFLTSLFILLFAISISAQDSDSTLVDSTVTITDSLTDTTASVNDTTTRKTEEKSDSTVLDSFPRLDKGMYLSPAWEFGSSPIFSAWYENQLISKAMMDSTYKADSIDHTSKFTQQPNDQSIAFPFSLGLYKEIDSTKSFTLGLKYTFQRKRSVFTYKSKVDSLLLYESNATITNNRLALAGSFDYTFNSEYFSVKGYPRTGFSIEGGLIPLNWIALENNDVKTTENSLGGMWGVGIFTEKSVTASLMRRVTIFYTGTVSKAYNDLAKELSTYAGGEFLRTGSFGIKIAFIFKRSPKVENLEQESDKISSPIIEDIERESDETSSEE